jgi:Flp pilus assembly protein TadD
VTRRTAARLAVGALLLAALGAAVFRDAAGFGFVAFDDEDYVVRNPQVLAGLTPSGAAWALRTTAMGSWHPLTWLSLMLDVQLFGPDPRWLHRTSLALHVASGVLLFLLLRGLTGAYWRSLLVAALFIAHPLHVESAVWISERKDTLSVFFWFLGALAYLRHVRRPAPARLVPVAALLACALAAKPMAVTFPLTLLLLDFWPLGRFRGGARAALLEKLPLLAVSAAAAAYTGYAQGLAGAVVPLGAIPLAARLANAASSVAWYCAKTVWPTGLAFFYPHPGAAAPVGAAVAAAAALVAVTAVLAWRRRAWPGPLTGWLWFLVTLAPVIGIVQAGTQARADRYAYVPLVGLFVAAAWALPAARVGRRGALAAGVLAAGWVGALGVAAHAQAAHWRDTRALAEHAARVAPSWMALEHLAVTAQLEGRPDEALALLRRAFELDPGNPQVHYNLGWLHEQRGQLEEALGWYRRAAAGMPRDAAPRTAAGVVLSSLGRYREAVPWLEQAVALDPDDPRAREALRVAGRRAALRERAGAPR